MPVASETTQPILATFSASAKKIFSRYDDQVIQRRKSDSSNIGAQYICQFTFQLLCRDAGGMQGVSDSLSLALNEDVSTAYAASSICDARRKYSADLFLDLNNSLLSLTEGMTQQSLKWNRRVFSIDGSKMVLPHGLLKSGFKKEKKESHYPTGRLSCLYEVGGQMIHDISLNSHMNERASAVEHLDKLREQDIVVYDRGFYSFLVMAEHEKRHIDFVFRVPEKTGIKPIDNFVTHNKDKEFADEIVVISPVSRKASLSLDDIRHDKKRSFSVRLIKYVHNQTSYILMTSLLDQKLFYGLDFSDIYHSRWGIEEAYKQIKVHVLKSEFHGKTLKTVCQEIYAAALLLNISRVLTFAVETEKESKKKFGEEHKEHHRADFAMAGQQIIRLLSNYQVGGQSTALKKERSIRGSNRNRPLPN